MIRSIRPKTQQEFVNPPIYAILSAAVFFGWILAVPFEGQIIRELLVQAGLSFPLLGLTAIGVHVLGLMTGALSVKSLLQAWKVMVTAVCLCLLSSLVLFMSQLNMWIPSILVMAYFSGIYVASWAVMLKDLIPRSSRYTAVVDVLILSNILMIALDMVTVNWSFFVGKILAMLLLFAVLFLLWQLRPTIFPEGIQDSPLVSAQIDKRSHNHSIVRPFAWLCLFILTITINSGIMYQIIMPAYDHFPLLASFYWAVPYIAALALLRNLPEKANRSNTLYLALAMMGLGYLLFMVLPANASSFVFVNTLMLGALGIFDLFWWSLMISFLDHTTRPAAILGVGLAANVTGILIGGIIGSSIMQPHAGNVSLAAFAVIFISLAILPLVNRELSKVFRSHVFLSNAGQQQDQDTQSAGESPPPDPMIQLRETYHLTDREMEIIRYLSKGYTYRAIAEMLEITEHTIKFHARNIYQKIQVKNKTELIRTITHQPPN